MSKQNKDVAKLYYDFMNQKQLMDRLMITGTGISFKNLINFLETRISQFSYKGLEKDLPSYVLRTALMFNNKLCFYNSKTFGITLCRYLPLGEYDFYWRPKYVDLLSLNGKTIASKVPFEEVVLVKDNKMDIPPFLWLMEYFELMDNIENTITKDIELLKLPAIFKGNEKMVTSFNTLINNAMGFKPFAVSDKMGNETFEMFDIKLPVSPEELLHLWKNYKNLALESIGISGTETQKRERLLVGEVESQSEYKNYKYNDYKECQVEWIEEYNSRFGRNVELVESLESFKDDLAELEAFKQYLLSKAEFNGEHKAFKEEKGDEDE